MITFTKIRKMLIVILLSVFAFTQTQALCDYEIDLYDDWGDGWNSDTKLVCVDGYIVLNNITLLTGALPEYIELSNPIMVIDPMSLYGTLWPNHTIMVSTNISNTGIGTLSYSFPDFVPGDGLFITSVLPSSGMLGPGESVNINITYDATGFAPGLYNEWLYIESNDPNRLYDSIFNEMYVYTPAQFAGIVTDGNTGAPLGGVEVTAGAWQTNTASDGTYSLYVDPGIYYVNFEKIGFQSVIVGDTTALAGVVTPIDVVMFEEAYPPGFVTATINDDDTECFVEWSLPWGPYEIIYDDGSADDYFVWSTMGNANAVKFTPAGYPATIIGGKIYVGDGSFPVGANFLGTTFGVVVYDDDGEDGLPGTQLDSILVTVDNYGWVNFEGLYAVIEDGDFFIAMFQGGVPPNTAPLGIDYTVPTVYRSYSYDAGVDVWALSAYQDFMIRAIVSGPQSDDGMTESTEIVYPTKPLKQNFITIHAPAGIPGTVKSGEFRPITDGPAINRDVVSYTIGRYSNFDPNYSPTVGDFDVLATGLTGFSYADFAFGGLPMGWYAYCVRAHYTNGDVSDCAVSNIAGHLMCARFIINVSLITGGNPEGAEVVLYAMDYPHNDYFNIMDTTGTDTIECVYKGYYDLCVFKPGYMIYCIETYIFGDTTININLEEKKYPPYNLYVDPLTSIATWNEPRITALKEDFNGALFPPQGWTSETQNTIRGWFATYNGSSYYFQIPPHDSQYACVNVDALGSSGGSGCCDYLITPQLDLRESEGYSLKFESYYDGGYGHLAFVEYSYDAGTTWEVFNTLSPATTWVDLEVDLSSFSGMTAPESIWLAFHSDDNGSWATGWAIDNVEVSVGNNEWPPLGYHVFLDYIYVAAIQETTYLYQNLTYGVEYEASVGAIYTSGLSEKDYYTFTSRYLVPPHNLQGMSPAGTDYVYLVWLPPVEPADYTILSEEMRTEKPDKNAEYSPTVRVIEGEGIGRDQWDVQYNFPVGVGGGEAGNESDGSYIYTTKWNGGNGTFYKYELDGTYLESFTIAGCQDVRDLAYDGTYMYGSNATTSVWEMDFDGQTVISTINAPTACRAVAYDEQVDGFWCNNWSSDIVLFDKTGTQLNSFPVGAYGNFYGFAYDGWSEGGPFLWGQSQDGSGAEIVQIDIATGLQIFNFNVLPLIGGSQIVGGMFSHCELIEPNLATLGGILQNELLYGLELAPCGGPGPVTSNLLGFNTYRDGVYQDYVEWISGNPSTLVDWYDFGLESSTYEYAVTAVYDLTPYGFPGDTAESMEEGPVDVTVTYGYPFPFFEDWQSGNFDLNEWTVECDNWCVNSQTGNPSPSAEFQYDPVLTDYECGLISHPLLAYGMVDGEIWFDFDIMLDSRFDTAVNEKMIVKIWENHEWHVLAEFINQGDMDWASNHIDITTIAKGSDFKLGFFAAGLNSIGIIGWYIDNINVYRVCRAPFDLTAEMEWYTSEIQVYLNWIAPYAMQGEWLSYNDGTFENAIVSASGGAGLAQVFTPPQYPCTITQVRFFVSGYSNYFQDEEVYVLTGDGATILAGPYIIPGVADDWVTVDIDDVTITEGTFMVATFNVLPEGPYIGMDDSYYDATLYFGSIGYFTELGEYGYFCVGSHEAYVEYETSENVVVNSVLSKPKSNDKRSDIVMSNTFSDGTKRPDRDLLGFNIFRSWYLAEGEFELIGYTTDTIYTDTIYIYGLYCYYVTAIYDQCESDSSNNACVCFPSDIEELGSENTISVYPNPAKDFINIISTENINKVTIINFAGQKVFEKKITEKTNIKLNTASYETGVYIIKIETEDEITAKRVAITR